MTGVLLQKTTEVKPLNVKAMNAAAWCFSGTQSSLRGQKVAAGQKPSFSKWANFEVVAGVSMHHIRLYVNAERTGIDSHVNTLYLIGGAEFTPPKCHRFSRQQPVHQKLLRTSHEWGHTSTEVTVRYKFCTTQVQCRFISFQQINVSACST